MAKKIITASALSLIAVATLAPAAQATYEPSTPALGVYDTYKASNTVEVNIHTKEWADYYLQQVRATRAAAWDANLPLVVLGGDAWRNDDMTVRGVAKYFGYETKEAYVNAVSYDSGLEEEGLIRATEILMIRGHQRPNNIPASEAIVGSGFRSENLTAGSSPDVGFGNLTTTPRADLGGKSEWDLLVQFEGSFNAGNGHLYNILTPEYTHFGIGSVTNVNDASPVTVMRFAKESVGQPTSHYTSGRYTVPIDMGNNTISYIARADQSTYTAGETGKLNLSAVANKFANGFSLRTPGTWVSTNESVATVADDGTITTLSAGTVSFNYVSSAGDLLATATISVNPAPEPEPVDPEPSDEPVVPAPSEDPVAPTPDPTEEPTPDPSEDPVTPDPTDEPTPVPSEDPATPAPTPGPTDEPTPAPSEAPATPDPTDNPVDPTPNPAEPTDGPADPTPVDPTPVDPNPVDPVPSDEPVDPVADPIAVPSDEPTDPATPIPADPTEPASTPVQKHENTVGDASTEAVNNTSMSVPSAQAPQSATTDRVHVSSGKSKQPVLAHTGAKNTLIIASTATGMVGLGMMIIYMVRRHNETN